MVYTLLHKTERRNSLKILFMSYNEEVLEELVVEVEEKVELEESVVNHICNNLNRQSHLLESYLPTIKTTSATPPTGSLISALVSSTLPTTWSTQGRSTKS